VDNICPPFQERRSLPFHIGKWQRFTAHVKVEAEFPRSYKSVFGSFFFIVVLTNISFKTIHFIIRYTSGMISN